jgi:hypothetical protein
MLPYLFFKGGRKMAKKHIKFDEDVTGMIQFLCDKHNLAVEDLFVKLVVDEYNRTREDVAEK